MTPETPMRERMARKMAARYGDPETPVYNGEAAYVFLPGTRGFVTYGDPLPRWTYFLGSADEALDALMEPTEGMQSSLRTGTPDSDINPFWVWGKNAKQFTAMIQAAKDGK